MNTAELQLDLINKIANLTDKVRLNELLQLLKFQSEETMYITNEEEKNALSEARAQINEGKILTNEQVQREFKEWLEK